MKLPGGLLHDGTLMRSYSLKPLTGHLQRSITESGHRHAHLPQQITAILTQAVDSIGGLSVNEALITSLSGGDRHFLMQQLSAMVNPYPQWLTVDCESCHETLQIQWQASQLPVKSAGQHYPETIIKLSTGPVQVRVPTGADEHAIADTHEPSSQAVSTLLKRLIHSEHQTIDLNHLKTDDKALLDGTIEDMMPQVAEALTTECPYCQHPQQVPIDAYAWIMADQDDLDQDIHTIASCYHWSEQQILDLPVHRRQRYLQLIQQQSAAEGGLDHGVMA